MNRPGGPDPIKDLWQRVQARPAPVVIIVLVATIFIAQAGFPWIWLLGGAIVLAVLWPTVMNTGSKSAATHTPSTIQNTGGNIDLSKLQPPYLDLMQRALNTSRRIQEAISQTRDPGQRRVLADATKDLGELTGSIYELACKAQSVHTGIGANPMEHLTEEMKRLETAISGTNDEFQKSQYYAAMDGKLQQMQNITDAMVALRRWDAQVENAVSTLETLLSQVLRIKSSEVLSYSGDTDDLSVDLKREVDSLKAAAEAMDSVYSWQQKV